MGLGNNSSVEKQSKIAEKEKKKKISSSLITHLLFSYIFPLPNYTIKKRKKKNKKTNV